MIDRRTLIASGLALASLPAAAMGGTREDERLQALLRSLAEGMVDASPQTASALGLDTGARAGLRGRLDDRSPAGQDAQKGSWLLRRA